MEECLFHYPDSGEDYISEWKSLIKARNNCRRKALISLVLSSILFIISSATHFQIMDYIAIAVFLYSLFQLIVIKKVMIHRLEIIADEQSMKLTYFNSFTARKQEISLNYTDIVKATFLNKYTEMVISFNTGHGSGVKMLDENDKEIENKTKNVVRFSLNEYTPEQGFFLYTAPELFEISINKKKMLGKFGDMDCYYTKIYGEGYNKNQKEN